MDPQIVGASIGAAGAVVAAVVAAIAGIATKRARSRRDEAVRGTIDASRSARDKYLGMIGYVVDRFYTKMSVAPLRSEATEIKTYTGVKVLKKGVTIPSIPGRAALDHPLGKINSYPQLLGTPSLPTKAVALRIVDRKEKDCRYDVEVTGGLTESDLPLDYTVQVIYSHSYCVTKEEMEETYRGAEFDKEYHRADVVYPINTLHLELEFPENYRVQAYPVVFFPNSDRIMDMELERVRTGFNRNAPSFTLVVEQPRIGFGYAIYWIPPPVQEVELLRRQ